MDATTDAIALDQERADAAPVLELVIPVHDEERGLECAVRTTRAFLDRQLPYPARLTIADNASTDDTWPIACRLADELDGDVATRIQQWVESTYTATTVDGVTLYDLTAAPSSGTGS